MESLAEGPENEPDNQLVPGIEVKCVNRDLLEKQRKMQSNWAK